MDSLNKEILRLALPAIFSNITVPLLGLSDTFISGHLGSETYIAAIAAGTMMVNAIYWLCGFLRTGTTGLTAEAFGRGDADLRRRIFTFSFILAASLGLLLILLSWPLSRLMIAILSPAPETGRLAVGYFMITIFAAPAQMATMTVTGWMIGSQNTFYPMIIAIAVNVINIALSFSAVYWLGLGFYGVAIGTLCANWLGLGIALLLSRRLAGEHAHKSGAVGEGVRLFAPLKGLARSMDHGRFFKVNSDLFMRSACIMSVTFAMTAFGGRMGDMTLARNAIVMQMFLLFSYFSDGFAYSGEALCGRFSGARDYPQLRRAVRLLLGWSGCVAVVFFLLYWLFTGEFAALLTDDREVVAGVEALKWVVCLIPPLSATAFIMDGIYIGLTKTRAMFFATFAAMAMFFVVNELPGILPGLMIGVRITKNAALWAAFLTFLALRGIILGTLLPSRIKG